MPDHQPVHSISVITPTYNKAALLELTLASYLHQTYKSFELVVVDDGSTDNTRQVVERYQSRLNIKYVFQPNRGRSVARNRAILEATGDILVFSDDDRLAAPGFLAAHARAFSSPQDNLFVLGGQAGFLSQWDKRQELLARVAPLFKRSPELEPLLTQNQKLQLVSAEDIEERYPRTLEKFSLEEPWWELCKGLIAEFSGDINRFRLGWIIGNTGNMAVSRQRTIDIGMFDESFSKWGIEDTELCFRMCQEGARIVVSEEALSYHQVHPRSSEWNEEWHRNFARFWAKFDSVQIPLFYLFVTQQVTAREINAIVDECDALEREGRMTLVNELKRLYRLAVHTTQSGNGARLPDFQDEEPKRGAKTAG